MAVRSLVELLDRRAVILLNVSNNVQKRVLMMLPKIMPVTDLRRNTSDVLSTLREDAVVYITQHGRPTAVLLDYERYEVRHRRDVYR